MLREIPPGSGISGRPILEDQPNVEHIAYHHAGVWYTWCERVVPEDHRCPDRKEIEATYGVLLNCFDCHKAYKESCQARSLLPALPKPRLVY